MHFPWFVSPNLNFRKKCFSLIQKLFGHYFDKIAALIKFCDTHKLTALIEKNSMNSLSNDSLPKPISSETFSFFFDPIIALDWIFCTNYKTETLNLLNDDFPGLQSIFKGSIRLTLVVPILSWPAEIASLKRNFFVSKFLFEIRVWTGVFSWTIRRRLEIYVYLQSRASKAAETT